LVQRRTAQARYRAVNRATINAAKRKKAYGLSEEDYHTLLEAQGYRCACCGTDHPGRETFAVDHDHDIGTVRGLLCLQCNVGLGMFKDDPDRLRSAAVYLEMTSE
jgi:hypothetical protein